jgi:hypothetical protein
LACGCCDNNEQADKVLIELVLIMVKPPPSVMIVAVFLLCPEKYLPLPTSRRDDGYISIFILTRPDQKSGHFSSVLVQFCCYRKGEKPPTRYQSAVCAAQSCLTLKNGEYITSG